MKYFVFALVWAVVGCSPQQWYASGRAAQRQQCAKEADALRRDACYKDADLSYDRYKSEAR